MNRVQYELIIRTLGIPMVFHQVKTPAITKSTIGGIATAKNDDPVVNSYGIGAKVITLMQSEIPTPPEKFDFVTINAGAEKVVFEAVFPVHEPKTGAVIGFRCIAKGK
jgi:hypothetical protein